MNRRVILALSAIAALGLGLLPASSFGQQKSLKEQLVGTWMVVSCESTSANGAKQPFCANPNGVLILAASGRYASVIAARGRPKLPSGNRSEVPAEQFKAAALGVAANFGTWSVNEGDKTMTFHYEGALFPNIEGTEVKNTVTLSGDELKVVQPAPVLGGRGETVYRRVR
jgi:Lipocalin-like domain